MSSKMPKKRRYIHRLNTRKTMSSKKTFPSSGITDWPTEPTEIFPAPEPKPVVDWESVSNKLDIEKEELPEQVRKIIAIFGGKFEE